MIIENNKNSVTKSIDEELNKVENYIEQALFYARSNTVEKDYYIKKDKLKEIVNESIKKNKNILIQEKIEINTHDLDKTVNTDSKWIVFILNQIIQNSVKYRNKEIKSTLEIYSKQGKENIILYIKDNGIGLYLSKKLCNKLGIAIELNSKYQKETEVKIIFPNSSHTNLI